MSAREFAGLQAKLRPLWETISRFNDVEQTIVVVPSISVEAKLLEKFGDIARLFEERMLFLLLLLRQPRARLIFLSSLPIDQKAIDYYLSLLPGVIPHHAQKRLFLLSPNDPTNIPLSQKALSNDSLVEEVRSLIVDFDRAHMIPYITTDLERELALRLGIPMYGCDPRYLHLGTKSWSRQIFEEEGVMHARGRNHLKNIDHATESIAELRANHPGMKSFVLKLDEGAAGLGNAILDLTDVSPRTDPAEIRNRIESLDLGADFTAAEYIEAFNEGGGAVEELIEGTQVRSPSVQMRVTPLGEVEVLSTHDQLLGGQSKQSYLGCIFPADHEYAGNITIPAERIGRRLAHEGVLGRFAVDFLTVRSPSGWVDYAIEINLRKGGTTHPYLTLQFLTGGTYDPQTSRFQTPRGEFRSLVATDHAHLRTPMTIDELFDRAVVGGLHFDNSRQTGVVFHMLGGVEGSGVFGLTAVQESREQAKDLFERSVEILEADVEGI